MEWVIKTAILLVNLGIGLVLFLLTEGKKYQDGDSGAKNLFPLLLVFSLSLIMALLLGFRFISPKGTGVSRLLALLVMTLSGVLIFTVMLCLQLLFEDGLRHAASEIVRQIKSAGLLTVFFGFFARQLYFFLMAILVSVKIWLPLWLLNFFLFKMLK